MMIDDDQAWAAFARRDRSHDGQFVVGVRTTGIYCRPSCAARRPRRDNVAFYRGEAEATAAGLRACLRCRPDAIARDQAAVRQALAMIDAGTELPTLAVLGRATGYSPAHLQRLFTTQVGVSPAAYARARRAARLERALDEEDSVTTAIYAAGYSDRRASTPTVAIASA
jgi:AraC family transcriptional regulator of adaptative response/methylated-DNA-[protein]-cysteine methyltransferase